uniref:Integron gene cassette protein n=1 Tax=Taenia asiatica TaxID=60517 RepID=A0A0R3W1L9_TAEAS
LHKHPTNSAALCKQAATCALEPSRVSAGQVDRLAAELPSCPITEAEGHTHTHATASLWFCLPVLCVCLSIRFSAPTNARTLLHWVCTRRAHARFITSRASVQQTRSFIL